MLFRSSRLVTELGNPDPFVRQAAWCGLARSGIVDYQYPIQDLKNPDQRAGVALLWRHTQDRRAATRILQLLKEHDGFLPYHDKSDPEEIYEFFGISKKTFKMSVGNLYKQKLISIEPNGIRLIAG